MTNGQAKERVGIVGAGRMGHAMLKHLVKHGYSVTACDVSAEALANARAAGAATAEHPRRSPRLRLRDSWRRLHGRGPRRGLW